jgi:hypothetical protein
VATFSLAIVVLEGRAGPYNPPGPKTLGSLEPLSFLIFLAPTAAETTDAMPALLVLPTLLLLVLL